MKRVLFTVALAAMVAVSCEKDGMNPNSTRIDTGDTGNNEIYWADNAAYHIWFRLIDENQKDIILEDKEALYNIEIVYDGTTYKYEGDKSTRAISFLPFAIRTNSYHKSCFGFGDFNVSSKSKFTIKYGDNTWDVEQSSELNPNDVNGEIILSVKINGEIQSREPGSEPYTLNVK